MKKTFLTLLIAALGVWGYVVAQIILLLLGKTSDASQTPRDTSLPILASLSRRHPALDTTLRDPFQSYLYAQKPAPPAPAHPKAAAVLKIIEPPKVTVNGILWGDQPVAILQQNGETQLVKVGAEVWGLKVLGIDRHQVTVLKEGRKFTLEY